MITNILTPIIAADKIEAAQRIIDQNERFVITAHMSPDGDAVGSTFGLCRYLQNKGKQAIVVFNDTPGDNLKALMELGEAYCMDSEPDKAIQAIGQAQVIFCLDYNALYRTADLQKYIEANTQAKRILIDHHLDPEAESFNVVISYPQMCATCELIYRFIVQSQDEDLIDAVIASCLYTGIMTDTGMLTYNSNAPETYIVVANLIAKGIDKEKIHRNLAAETERCLRLKGYVLNKKMKVLAEHHAAYFCLSKPELKEYNHQKGDSEGFVNIPLSMRQVSVSAYFREEKNFVKVSLRSKGDYPVNIMAEKFFNGGGHKNAAGGEFLGSIQQAEVLFVKILPLFDKYLDA